MSHDPSIRGAGWVGVKQDVEGPAIVVSGVAWVVGWWQHGGVFAAGVEVCSPLDDLKAR